ncbi:MAG: alpha/beta hydrolase-fold protein [Steroidobacteraceae bacterium]
MKTMFRIVLMTLVLTGMQQAVAQSAAAKGDQQRQYHFQEAGKDMPYRLYVPAAYDASKPTPLVVALHGFGGDQDSFFKSVKNLLALCDQYGFIFVAPMGYSPGSWFGSPMAIPGVTPKGEKVPVPGIGEYSKEVRARMLSELDVINVLDLVRGEYNIDSKRTYLMGHSMGGFGAWYLGDKYIDLWAAIAPMSGINEPQKQILNLKNLTRVPVMVAVGEQEAPTVITSKEAVASLKAAGADAAYVEIAGGSHGSMVAPSTAQIFDFFSKRKKTP